MKRNVTIAGGALAVLLGMATPAAAHTDSDLVGVPAGSASTVTLQPTHGCGDSPTVAVRIRAPFPEATATAVDGWTATATPDGAGNTVLEWTGGVLPADQEGAFPVAFTAPPTPGVLLTFPAIQVCENGEELAWISGDPADEYPAPRLLVLPADAEPAATIDDVPLDAPGRDQLVAIVDVDNPAATTTTVPPATTAAPSTTNASPATSAGVPTTARDEPATTPATTGAPATDAVSVTTESDDDRDDGGGLTAPIVVAVVAVAAIATGVVVFLRRRGGG